MLSIIKKEWNSIKKSEFARNVTAVASGNAFSQIIPFFVAPIITRLFSPEDFGTLALFTSTAAFVQGFSTLKYESAIQIPKKEEDVINIMALSFFSVIFFSIITAVIIIFFNDNLATLMNSTKIGKWLYFVPVLIFIGGTSTILNVWTSRKKKFNRIAFYNIVNTTVTPTTKIFFGLMRFIDGGLILGTLMGSFISKSLFAFNIIRKDNIDFSVINQRDIIRNAREYKDFPIYSNSQQIIGRISEIALVYLISNFFGSAILGWYSFSKGLLYKPIFLIGQAISNVYYQKAAEIVRNRGNLWLITKKIITRIFLIGLIIFTPIVLWGPFIFSFVFGSEWVSAGKYAQILSPFILMIFIEQGMSMITLVLKKQKQNFVINAIYVPIFLVTIYLIGKYITLEFYNLLIIIVGFQMTVMFIKFYFWRKWAKDFNNE